MRHKVTLLPSPPVLRGVALPLATNSTVLIRVVGYRLSYFITGVTPTDESQELDMELLSQGKPYGRNSHEVEHVYLEGTVAPSSTIVGDDNTSRGFVNGSQGYLGPGSYHWKAVEGAYGDSSVTKTYVEVYCFDRYAVSGMLEHRLRRQSNGIYKGPVIIQSTVVGYYNWPFDPSVTTRTFYESGFKADNPQLPSMEDDEERAMTLLHTSILRVATAAVARGVHRNPRYFVVPVTLGPSPVPLDIGLIRNQLGLILGTLCQRACSIDLASVSRSIAKQAVSGQQAYDGNVGMLLSKLPSLGSSVEAAAALLKDPSLKTASGAWLAGRFGDRLAERGWKSLYDSIRSELKSLGKPNNDTKSSYGSHTFTVDINGTQISCVSRGHLVAKKSSYNAAMTAVKKLYDWDIWPTLQNAYDAVPLSFVADWVLNCSTILDNIDKMAYSQYLNVVYYERSDSFHCTVTESHGNFNYHLTFHLYRRRKDGLPNIGLLDDWDVTLPRSVNYADGTALLIQFAPQ